MKSREYGTSFNRKGVITAPSNKAYNFGTGDFSVVALIKPSGTGTIISRKSTAGGPGHGGWLLVLKSAKTIKFSTDDGYGFYEVNGNAPNSLTDGKWHHVAAVRSGGAMSIYVDGKPIPVIPRTNRFTPLDVNNDMGLMIGGTDQQQEPYNRYRGYIEGVALWNSALGQQNIVDAMNNSPIASQTKGYWTLDNTTDDISPIGNNGSINGSVPFVKRYLNLPFNIQHQQQTNWCWTAVPTSTSIFYNPNSTWTQCTLVNSELDRNDCCQQGGSSNCDKDGYLDKALDETGNLDHWTSGAQSFATCRTQENNWRPLGARIGWSGGGGHFVVVSGTDSSQYVQIQDPWSGESHIPYSIFVSKYQGSGSWTHSYFTKP